jgi:hypothetical protein
MVGSWAPCLGPPYPGIPPSAEAAIGPHASRSAPAGSPGEPLAGEEPPIEFRFILTDQWSRHLFVALMRRYGIHPYRYRGQRRTTVMARLSRLFRCPHRSGD